MGFKWYSANTIPKDLKVGQPIIVNTDLKSGFGVHWITMIKLDPKNKYVYDPLGKNNPRISGQGQLVDSLLLDKSTHLYPYESEMRSSKDCGYFAIFVARLMKKAFARNPSVTSDQIDALIQKKFGKTADKGDVKHLSSIKNKIKNKKEEDDIEPEGAGLKEIWRHFKGIWNAIFKGNRHGFAPRVRSYLEQYGNFQIVSLRVCRKPIQKIINNVIDFVGTSETAHDTLFHLFLVVTLYNGLTLVLEKNEQVNIKPYVAEKTDDLRSVSIGSRMTLNVMLNNAILKVGIYKLTDYDAIDRNCQIFVIDVLKSNNIPIPPNLYQFIVQNMKNLIPSWIKRFAYFGTSIANRLNQVIEGEGNFLLRKLTKKIHS
jgi:uncharacterized protein YneF (UPF0154 family)